MSIAPAPPPPAPAEPIDDSLPLSYADRIRSRLVTTDALRQLPPPRPLVDGWFNLDSLAMVYGPSGAGKSFVAIDLAMTIGAARHHWHGNTVTHGGVVYVVAEGILGASMRTTAWETHHGTTSAVTWHPGAVNVMDRLWAEALAEVVAELRPVLVVIDTFARSIVGADENSTKDVGIAIENLDMIRRAAGSCVLIVHHAGKDLAKGARGSTSLKGAVDTEVEIVGTEGRIVARCTKQKDGPEAPPLHFKLSPVDGCDSVVLGHVGALDVDKLTAAALDTLAALRDIDVPGGVSTTAWLLATGATERTFYRHRGQLVAHNMVVNIGTEGRPRYRPSPDGGGSDE